MEALGRALKSFHEKHEKIKHTVHTVRMQLIEDIAIFFLMYLLLTQLSMLKYLATSIHTIKIGLEISSTKMGTICNGLLLLHYTRRRWMVCNAMGNL